LIDGYAALRETRVREIQCDGYSVHIQFNPGRIASTGAKVDPKSISERKCFLCLENLPSEQKAILYQEEFLILCNPVPIFDKHLTVTHTKHIPQSIEEFIPTFLALARSMSPAFTVFYNGPQCGASAPDHLHFQACPAGAISLAQEMMIPTRRELKKSVGEVTLYSLKDVGRQAVIIDGTSAAKVASVFTRMISVMQHLLHTNEEPMMNALCSYLDGTWRVLVIPRRKHRPDVFFKDGEEQVMISPALVDIGGMVVAPIEKDFHRVDGKMIQSIYDEVLWDRDSVDRLLEEV
jgi:ATP adenylyltransferase/5',5'''-P-1,P-4-tetraphosphate phosphorylase II